MCFGVTESCAGPRRWQRFDGLGQRARGEHGWWTEVSSGGSDVGMSRDCAGATKRPVGLEQRVYNREA